MSQQRRGDDLLRGFQGRVSIDANFVWVPVTFAGSILSISEIICGDKHIDHFRTRRSSMLLRIEAGKFIARELFPDKLIKRLVGVDRPNHIVAVTVR